MKTIATFLAALTLVVVVGCDSNPDGPSAPTTPPDASVNADAGKASNLEAKGRGRKVGGPGAAKAD